MKVEPGNILKLFLNFSNFEPQYSYKLYSYKKECICKKQSQNIVFVPSEKLYFEIFSSASTMVGPKADSGYKGICNTPSVNFAYKTLVKWLSYDVLHLQKPISK